MSWLTVIIQKVTAWVKKAAVITASDVLTAFDQTSHERLYEAGKQGQIDLYAVLAVLRDYTGKTATISIAGAGTSEPFDYTQGGWPGGASVTGQYNQNIVYHVTPVVAKWLILGMGFRVHFAK